jgi:AraC-like DNA-binding protein
MVIQDMPVINLSFWPPIGNLTVFSAGTKVDPPGATFGPRKQVSYEFIWVRVGSVAVHINKGRFKGSAGTLLLVPSGVTDRYDWSKRGKNVHSFIHFFSGPASQTPDIGVPPIPFGALPSKWPLLSNWPLYRHFQPGHTIFQLFRQVLSCSPLDERKFRPLLGPTLELILRLYLCGPSEPPREKDFDSGLSPTVERVFPWLMDRVRKRPQLKLRLEDIATAAAVSPPYLCRLFKKDLGIGPMECARLLKIEHACELLERSQLTIKEVSNLSGFENPFHFSRSFKEIYGVPPRSYRVGFEKNVHMRPYSPIFRKYQLAHFYSLKEFAPGFRLMQKKFKTKFSS